VEIRVSVTVVVDDDNGYSDSDVASCLCGMGGFSRVVKAFVEERLDDLAVSDVIVE
jgi:hypothetical protein